ncbi:MAG: glycosyltransferase family 4 protein [Thermoanaerobaculales bacterium]|nr:glycosyltransferase family 4 protein [Thermoanaerobaculales bacterium]
MRICLCSIVVPFSHGGAEILDASLEHELRARGFQIERIVLPFSWHTRLDILNSAMAWRFLELKSAAGEEIDLVISTRFPSYLIRHPNKVVWLFHQLRQAYDLQGTRYGFPNHGVEDASFIDMVRDMDARGLGEARALWSISDNVAERLRRFNSLEAKTLYPPLRSDVDHRAGEFGDYIFTVGRLDPLKRNDLLVEALALTRNPIRAVIAGAGPEHDRLSALIQEHNLEQRVDLVGWIDDQRLCELYAGCCGVFYAPYDEDYGYVTIEAFRSEKPVVTSRDSGGVLEFVADGETGIVADSPSPKVIADGLDTLFEDRHRARTMGQEGRRRVEKITWDGVITKLTGRRSADSLP